MKTDFSRKSIYSSIIHSKRVVVQPQQQFKAAFDVMRMRLLDRDIRCKTEGNQKTQGTCTNEDEATHFSQIELWSIFGRRDLYFMQSPLEIKLPQYIGQDICISLIDLCSLKCVRHFGNINKDGQIILFYKELVADQSQLFYVTSTNSVKCIYLCLIQGQNQNNKDQVKQKFHKFIKTLWKLENQRLCFGCYLEFIHLLVWDPENETIWTLLGCDLHLIHNKFCLNSKKKKPQLNISTDLEKQKSISQAKSFHIPAKLVMEDKLNFVMNFIKPHDEFDKNRINNIVVMKSTLLRPKTSVERQKKNLKITLISKAFSPKSIQSKR